MIQHIIGAGGVRTLSVVFEWAVWKTLSHTDLWPVGYFGSLLVVWLSLAI